MKEFDAKGCYSYSKISKVAIPILLSMLVEHLIGMTDTAFLGRVSEVALGASALGTVYFLIFFVLGSGFSYGAQILIARRNGEKNYSKIGQICYASGFFLLIMAVILTSFIIFCSDKIMPLLISSQNVCKATVEYMEYRAYGLIFVFATALFRAFYVGIAQTKILTYSSVLMVLSNIVLNYALIFGKFGMPQMGIAGAALASAIAEGIAMLSYMIYTLKNPDLKKFGFHAYSAFFRLSILKKVFSVSFWMMLQPFLSVAVWFFFFIAVERLGERPLAVINLARSVSALPFIIIHAFATSCNSLVSNLIGEGKTNQVWRLLGKVMLTAFVIVTPLLIFFSAFPELTLRVYTDNADLIQASINVMYVMSMSTFLQISAFILFNTVSGTGAVKMTAFIETVTLLIYVVFVWFIIIRNHPSPAMAWTVEIIYQGFSTIFCLLYLLSGKWKNRQL